MAAGGKCLRCDSDATTSGIRHVRGRTHGLALEKAHIAGKLSIHIPDGHTSGDDKASLMLSSHIGSLVRSHVPFDVVNWSKVPDDVKSYVMNKVLDDFNLDYYRSEDRNTVMSTMNIAYKTHQNKMHQYYTLFPTKERMSEINRQNRAKLTVARTSGARSFQQAQKDAETDQINPALTYKKTHINKDNEWTSDTAGEHFEKMEVLQLQHESEGRLFIEVEIFTKVLGMKAGYVHGLGRSMWQVGLSSLMSSVDLAQRLEDARMEIEEMRARQKKYDELVMRQAEMERVMREQ
ncbi:hypothetical protein CJ030_MR7G017761 [Morella rubra]|uniref:Uncharacterized protein n=1 Tax=Morella rubra TaxID=262757 RepID=A0A6A1UYW4_9ROSI|nr:hypothetical protein CJ030_MR7G017761 [Morella rubra]